tara:strand:+ start:321 stop:866 length:546 start_codon:yes stop_codon:yes gene_type:complete
LEKSYDEIAINIFKGETLTNEFLSINPKGTIPVLIDKDIKITDSASILVYLASKYGDEKWLPLDPIKLANIIQWLVLEQNEGRYGLARARLIKLKIPSDLAKTGSIEESLKIGTKALDFFELQLKKTQWLVGDGHPTIADIACFPYVAMSHQGGFLLKNYNSINRWIKQISDIPGYVKLPD